MNEEVSSPGPEDGFPQPTGMLEVKDLRKEYKTKQGVVTKALDGVSLTFPETGMVFILGKSGSGKSTLLNVCGGLDRMDSGEIIIKGKSSKSFSGKDFDSYRNTFVGFVFQEYNILNEFTVEQNIALALELQNKKADKEKIASILADVDMTDFAKRKPNTLSGGQKQRVAIARALVKDPEIIMADEPTGALDSNTGRQVFDTLKKLSENKLVLVISHDRDFAEQYGDRIIELKDGKVISDCVRAESDDKAKNVRFYGTDTVTVADGSKITDEELASIKTFLTRSGGSAVISTSRENITKFKEDKPEIAVGAFEQVESQPAPKAYESPKLIRSHLPIRHAARMGASGLKTKPVRLVFTILLSVVAFVMFGLVSTLMLFNERDVRVKTFKDSELSYITLGKQYKTVENAGSIDEYVWYEDRRMTAADYEKLASEYSGAIPAIYFNLYYNNVQLAQNAQRFYSTSINTAVPASANLTVLAGRKPIADDEIMITDFMYDAFKSSGTRFCYGENFENLLTINSFEDILYSDDMPIVLSGYEGTFKIVGVFKSASVSPNYKKLKDLADRNEYDEEGLSDYTWYEESRRGMYSCVAMTDSYLSEIVRQRAEGEYSDDPQSFFSYVYVPYDGSTERIEKLLDLAERVDNFGTVIRIRNSASDQLDSLTELASEMERYFTIAGIVFALFAFLLMFNFISVSITAKKKDIGILRAIGARTTDVFGIFVIEAMIIALICFAISSACVFGLCSALNSMILNDIGIAASLFVFGPLPLLCVLGIAVFTAFISTIIPVAIYSRKPPIASIRAL